MRVRNQKETSSVPQFSRKSTTLYIHFPFCSSICNYCPFSKSMNMKDAHRYCEALLREFDILHNSESICDTSVDSLFFGGGTPSLIPLEYLDKILVKAGKLFGTIPQITMECNPESLTLSKALEYKRLGITRLSIGVQSFQHEILSELGRASRPVAMKKCISEIISAGFSNISVDLIYGFEKQDQQMLLDDINEAIRLGVEHISIFPLINYNNKNRQELTGKQYKHQFSLYQKARRHLEERGFESYSIEDFSRTERAKNRYQEGVWQVPQKDCIILGSSGFGMTDNSNYTKMYKREEYCKSIESSRFPMQELYTTPLKSLALRRFLMGLHYNSVHLQEFTKHYGPITKRVRVTISILKLLSLIDEKEGCITTTEEGAFVTSLLWAKIMLSRMSRK